MTGTLTIPITVRDHDVAGAFGKPISVARTAWPIRFGVPFPKSALTDPGKLVLRNGTQVLPVQMQVTNRWPDGSIRWLSLLALVDLEAGQTKMLILESGSGGTPPEMEAVESAQEFSLSNKSVALRIARDLSGFGLRFQEVELATAAPALELELVNGQLYRPVWEAARLEREGALRSRVVFNGRYVSAEGQPTFDVEFGIELTAAQPWVECFHRMTHRVSGQPQLAVRRLTLRQTWQLPDGQYVIRQLHRGEEWLPRDVMRPGAVEVRVTPQRALVADHAMVGEIPSSYPPYLQKGLDGVEPWLAWQDAQTVVMFWTPEPVGHSPQTWKLADGEMTIDWIPATADPAVFTQGRAKTHRWRWHFAPRSNAPYASLSRLHSHRPLVNVDPAWVRSCRVTGVDRALAFEPRQHPRFEGMLDALFEIKWPTGMMNWGDDVDENYTNNYRVGGIKPDDAVWTNNEYDFLLATFQQMLRTGRSRLWRVIERAAQHALDIDFMHFSDDPWLHHGSPVHSARHTTASSYPSHIWTEGLLHYYYWSGDTRALEVAKLSGGFLLRFADKRGWVLELTAREAGWSLLAFTELFAVTGEEQYRQAARRVAGRIIDLTERGEPVFPTDASFFLAVLVMGLDKLHDHDPDERIPRAIDQIMQWRLENRLSPEGVPLYHWDAGARMINTREIMFPGALAIAYRHTQNPVYLETLWRVFQYWLDMQTFQNAPRCTKTAAAYYRTWVEALAVLEDAGLLARLEYQALK